MLGAVAVLLVLTSAVIAYVMLSPPEGMVWVPAGEFWMGSEQTNERGEPLFPDAARDEKSWFVRHNVTPINHMVVVSESLVKNHPGAVREVSCLLHESAELAPASSPRFNAEDLCRSLEMIIRYTAQQGLIPRVYTLDEIFDDLRPAAV